MNVAGAIASIAAIIMIVALLVIGWRLERWLTNRAADRQAIEIQRLRQEREHSERELALKERELAFAERKPPTDAVPSLSEFPAHLLAVVGDESEEWAREDALRVLGEAYAASGGDWKKAEEHLGNRYMAQPESRLSQRLLDWNRIS